MDPKTQKIYSTDGKLVGKLINGWEIRFDGVQFCGGELKLGNWEGSRVTNIKYKGTPYLLDPKTQNIYTMARTFVGKLNGWDINFNLESKKHKKFTEKELTLIKNDIIDYDINNLL